MPWYYGNAYQILLIKIFYNSMHLYRCVPIRSFVTHLNKTDSLWRTLEFVGHHTKTIWLISMTIDYGLWWTSTGVFASRLGTGSWIQLVESVISVLAYHSRQQPFKTNYKNCDSTKCRYIEAVQDRINHEYSRTITALIERQSCIICE